MSADRAGSTTSMVLPVQAMRRLRERLYASISPAEILRRLKLNPQRVRLELKRSVISILEQERLLLGQGQKDMVVDRILDDVLGFGPIEPLLKDQSVSEIMVNGPGSVYAERNGALAKTGVSFEDDDHLLNVIDKIVAPIGRRVDESSPMVDARLPDGSRVNIVIPPIALTGPTITIRKFPEKMFTFTELTENGSIRADLAAYLKSAVERRSNMLVTGGTGSGKTTLLNALSNLIPPHERIVTIEDAAELRFTQPHVVRLESRPPNVEGRGRVAIRDLVINALRMRPDRIVVGEVRGGETLDMLQAMNTGHDGSLTTAHANSPLEALSRLETMALMAGMDLPLEAVRRQIAGAIDVIIHMSREPGGRRILSDVVEVTSDPDGKITLTAVGDGV